ncbi:MAG: hypothetical protein AVDCRST_MAG12-753 [uncultured Rubrobacteraceae bacterium]|uniref:Uncharacterized protein n=1 Tax=uncultured Rubrobacteraceae bacterium TaxID=349277 RepID=A0A6J4RIW9_9ACTN|nr:MAG: hypothetical protein AVDCRST_MAG12-753 [uncultured Rubrobacteraceae bacterium]
MLRRDKGPRLRPPYCPPFGRCGGRRAAARMPSEHRVRVSDGSCS